MLLAGGRRPLASLEKGGQPYGEACLHAARKILQDGASLPLLFPLHDLGFRYSAVGSSIEKRSTPDHLMTKTLCPGSRMPHLVLKVPGTQQQQGWISTVDLADQLHVALRGRNKTTHPAPFAVLITSEGCVLGLGEDAYLSLSPAGAEKEGTDEPKIPILVVKIVGPPSDAIPSPSTPKTTRLVDLMHDMLGSIERNLCRNGHVELIDELGQWNKAVRGLQDEYPNKNVGIILRPDGYILDVGNVENLIKRIYKSDLRK